MRKLLRAGVLEDPTRIAVATEASILWLDALNRGTPSSFPPFPRPPGTRLEFRLQRYRLERAPSSASLLYAWQTPIDVRRSDCPASDRPCAAVQELVRFLEGLGQRYAGRLRHRKRDPSKPL